MEAYVGREVIINCPYCGKKVAELSGEVKMARGTIVCPYGGKSFGWVLQENVVRYLYS